MTGSDPDTPAERGVPGTSREAAPAARPSPAAAPRPAAGFGRGAPPSPGVAPRPAVVFGRRAQPPVAPAPAAPARPDPPPLSTAAPKVNPPPAAAPSPVASARSDPPPLSTAVPNVNPPPQPAAPPGVQPDPSKLNDEAFLAAEAIRLGIRAGDEAEGSALDSDAKLIAEARRMGLSPGDGPEKGWTVPFDEEMERTAILLGIRSEESLGKPARRQGGAAKALPWIVMFFLVMAGLAGITLFMDTIAQFFRN